MKFETVVRPFQAGDVFTSRVLAPAQPAVIVEDVLIEWGQGNELQMTAIGVKDLNSGKDLREVDRKTTTVRVENPDDESQYVMIERIDALKFKDEFNADRSMTLNWT
jgi:hypothetical protein